MATSLPVRSRRRRRRRSRNRRKEEEDELTNGSNQRRWVVRSALLLPLEEGTYILNIDGWGRRDKEGPLLHGAALLIGRAGV